MNDTIDKTDELVMKLLHYFITEQDYSPIVLQGAQNEIWLENLNSDYKIVRIVSNYIHNDEQFNFDIFRTKQIMKKIKNKTLSLSLNALNIFINLGDNVTINETTIDNIDCVYINKIEDLKKYDFINKEFPNITKKTSFKEKGMDLFVKLTQEISNKSEKEAIEAEDVFSKKKPVITYALILINVFIFLLMYLIGDGSTSIETLLKFGASHTLLIQHGDYYRLITSMFLHIGVMHLIFNCYALYVIGPQIESFFGKTKYLIIYLVSGICGNLLSMLFGTGVSAGASGAIFGLLGAIVYFGYHYRIYLDGVLKSQIIPLILMNLALGFMISGINSAAHIGGLIGGVLVAWTCGVKYRSTKGDKINGLIMLSIFMFFLIFMAFRGL